MTEQTKKTHSDYFAGNEISEGIFGSRKILAQLAILIAVGLTGWVWFGIFSTQNISSTTYILDVGQGDGQLVVLPSENGRSAIKILIDGGKDRRVLDALDEALGTLNNKYIDIVLMTHTDLDHMGGLVEVVKRYDVGLFVSNGRTADSDAFKALGSELSTRKIPTITLLEGDHIRYGANDLFIMSPDKILVKSATVNEAGIVAMLSTEDKKILFTADIGTPTENKLLAKGYDLRADVLKVGHHGSKNSSGENFLAAVRPSVSVIGVGKNSYGHPTARVLETLELAGSRTYRTDESGTIKIPLSGDEMYRSPKSDATGFVASIASIISGDYKKDALTTVSLIEAAEEGDDFALIPRKECSFSSGEAPTYSPVILNEIAWMGSEGGATHEWIELRNTSGKELNLSGWQILNENERLHMTFPQKSSFNKQFIVLARSAANDSLGLEADVIFTGSIRNSNEGLKLFDNNCNLIDEVFASPSWPAGDNKTKKTMGRLGDLSWTTSTNSGGTPGR